METKLFARIGAGAFVAVALTMTVLQLREEPAAPKPEFITVLEPNGDPSAEQLRACSAMGELALSSHDCRAAWAEKRRRFLGLESDTSNPDIGADAAAPAVSLIPPAKAK